MITKGFHMRLPHLGHRHTEEKSDDAGKLSPRHQLTSNLTLLIENNRQWASEQKEDNPDYFVHLSAFPQQPRYLWIGCSDSRVPANQIVNMPPGEIFVHRNVANIIAPDDKNALSVIQYAVHTLKVKYIIVCGHTCCGGVKAAFGPSLPEPLEDWISPIRDVKSKHEKELAELPSEEARWRYLCEENVKNQIAVLQNLPIIQQAWENNQPLALHGWLFSLEEGYVHDMDVTVDNGSFQSHCQCSSCDSIQEVPDEGTSAQVGA